MALNPCCAPSCVAQAAVTVECLYPAEQPLIISFQTNFPLPPPTAIIFSPVVLNSLDVPRICILCFRTVKQAMENPNGKPSSRSFDNTLNAAAGSASASASEMTADAKTPERPGPVVPAVPHTEPPRRLPHSHFADLEEDDLDESVGSFTPTPAKHRELHSSDDEEEEPFLGGGGHSGGGPAVSHLSISSVEAEEVGSPRTARDKDDTRPRSCPPDPAPPEEEQLGVASMEISPPGGSTGEQGEDPIVPKLHRITAMAYMMARG